jgi:hypothetical protein
LKLLVIHDLKAMDPAFARETLDVKLELLWADPV